MRLVTRIGLVLTVIIMWLVTDLAASELAMGLRVGEVTQDSAIVWTRVTRDSERKWDGYREPKKRVP
ncbi:MAG: hypothetical protein ABGX07_07495, partial [Pirellulaceae bacterium]